MQTKWIEETLYDNYILIGYINNNEIILQIDHPNGHKIIKRKYINNIETEITIDDIISYFNNTIDKIKNSSFEKIQIICN